MAEMLTHNDDRTDHDAVEEMYNQAINNGSLDDSEAQILAQMAEEVGTSVDMLEKSRRAREEEARARLSNQAVQHYLNNESSPESWTTSKK